MSSHRCLWEGCSTACSTTEALSEHVSAVHSVRANVVRGELICKWKNCTRTPTFGGPASHAGQHLDGQCRNSLSCSASDSSTQRTRGSNATSAITAPSGSADLPLSKFTCVSTTVRQLISQSLVRRNVPQSKRHSSAARTAAGTVGPHAQFRLNLQSSPTPRPWPRRPSSSRAAQFGASGRTAG